MNKIIGLILMIIVFLTACSSSDGNTENNSSSINPPNWIQGTWLGELEGINSGIGFKFTSDDFCSIIGSQTSCFKASINQSQGLITVGEQIDNENYIISINNNYIITNTFHFRKYSNTEIEVVQLTGLNPRYMKQ